MRGGAERTAFEFARGLAARGHTVDALTTCCRSFEDDWSRNSLRAGVESVEGVNIHRYPVEARDRRSFTQINAALLRTPSAELKRGLSPLDPAEEAAFFHEGIRSRGLAESISERASGYDAIVLLPYLYGPVVDGVARAGSRAFLQPCLHDEPYAYLNGVANAHYSARRLLFNSAGEAELTRRLYGPGIAAKSRVLGLGIDEPAATPQDRVAGFVPQRERYVLYVGRQDSTKNLNIAVGAFDAYRRRYSSTHLKLVLVGDSSASFARHEGIVDLGYVSDDAKWTLLTHALALVQPSRNESYSRAIFESWLVGRPVVVHGACLATSTAVRDADGGWVAESAAEWEAAFARIDGDDQLRAFGERGRDYAKQYAAWDGVFERFEHVVREIADPPRRPAQSLRTFVSAGDEARSDYARALAVRIERAGIALADDAREVLVHVGSDAEIRSAPTDAALVVHEGGQQAAELLRGRRAPLFTPSRAVHAALREHGIDVDLWPYAFDERRWEALPDRDLNATLQDGNMNLVFSGPFRDRAPLEALLDAFLGYVILDGAVRLCLLATGNVDQDVFGRVRDRIYELQLVENVILLHKPSDAQRLAVFRNATLFWSMGDNDPFGVELRTAMYFDVPIIAFDEPLARELVGGSGVIFTEREDLARIGALAKIVANDPALRLTIATAQRRAVAEPVGERAFVRLQQWLDGA